MIQEVAPNRTYAGIGSRETPQEILDQMERLASCLESEGFTLYSGGADGADKAFERGVDMHDDNKKIFLPWKRFNSSFSPYHEPSPKAFKIAEQYHPAWERLSQPAKYLMARNSHQVLGEDLESPVAFVVCWTKNGGVTGGTGQAMRIAIDNNIPIFNLYHDDALEKIFKLVDNQIENLR